MKRKILTRTFICINCDHIKILEEDSVLGNCDNCQGGTFIFREEYEEMPEINQRTPPRFA